MGAPRLYLLIGYPGAGKTTVARIIHETTGAVHLWSDLERHKMFGEATHSTDESRKLYEALNRRTAALLAEGKSVVFDTNFNFSEDRRKLREIANEYGAETIIVWITIPQQLAHHRAVDRGLKRNGYHTRMTDEDFNRIIAKLEPPSKDEKVIKIDGAKLDRQTVITLLGQYDEPSTAAT